MPLGMGRGQNVGLEDFAKFWLYSTGGIRVAQTMSSSLFEDEIFAILTHLPMVDFFIFCTLEYEFLNKINFV